MTTAYTSLLGLALPVTGELSGTWGDVVNQQITGLLDSAVAGTTTLSTDGDVTLTTTDGASNQARQAILLCSGARTAVRNITAPAHSKIYTVINATTGGYAVVIRGVGPTTGISIPAGQTAQVAWNGSDFVDASNYVGGNLKVNGNLTVLGNTTLGNASADTVTVNGTITSNLLFTDNTYDIGADGSNRPRSGYFSTDLQANARVIAGGQTYLYPNMGSITPPGNATTTPASIMCWNYLGGGGAGETSFINAKGAGNAGGFAWVYWNGTTGTTNARLTATGDFTAYGRLLPASGVNALTGTAAMFGVDATSGAQLIGYGSSYDWTLLNRNGNIVLSNIANSLSMYASGSLGINSSADNRLSIKGSAGGVAYAEAIINVGTGANSSSAEGQIRVAGYYGDAGFAYIAGRRNGASTDNLLVLGSAGTAQAYLTTAGDFGLNTTSPTNFSGYRSFSASGSTGAIFAMQVGGSEVARMVGTSSGFDLYASGGQTTTLSSYYSGSQRINQTIPASGSIFKAAQYGNFQICADYFYFGTNISGTTPVGNGSTQAGLTMGWNYSSGAGEWNWIGAKGPGSAGGWVWRSWDGSTTSTSMSCSFGGAFSATSKSFKIEHPLPSMAERHNLVHISVESPQADLIYRGVATLVNGKASINIDENSGMTEGTFVLLCREVQCFTTNETDWTPVRGRVAGNILSIESQDETATSTISWMVIGERKDAQMFALEITDDNGKVIVEPLKEGVKA